MRLSQLMAELEHLRATHGDLPVWVQDADTGWLLDVTVEASTTVDIAPCDGCHIPHVRLAGAYTAPVPDFAAYAQGVADGLDPR